eukprot:3798787-Amphidinium_carterae.1
MVRKDSTAPESKAPVRQAPRQHSNAEKEKLEAAQGPTRHAPAPKPAHTAGLWTGAKPAAATRGSGDREVVQTAKRPAEAVLKSRGGQRHADPSSSSRGARQDDTEEGGRKKPKVLDKEPARASKRSSEEMQPAGSKMRIFCQDCPTLWASLCERTSC